MRKNTCRTAILVLGIITAVGISTIPSWAAFDVNVAPQPADFIENTPKDGEIVSVNPPSLIWNQDKRAASYTVELSQDKSFQKGVIRISGIPYSYYNYEKVLLSGKWYWRYFVVDKEGQKSNPGPTKSFIINDDATPIPVPSTDAIMENLPAHPRIFVTPDTLQDFQARRNTSAKTAGDVAQAQADILLKSILKLPTKRIPLEEARPQIAKVKTPLDNSWKPGDETRQQVFYLDDNGNAFWTPDYSYSALSADASKASKLAFAYLISGDKKYAEAARQWIDFVVQFRIDYHLGDVAHRGGPKEYSVIYCYEQGLKDLSVAYDHIYEFLSAAEREKVLLHVKYHTEAAVYHLKLRNIVMRYQQSHPQQALHNTLTTLLATAGDGDAEIDEMTRWIVPQYMNRIAWTAPDGGYSEGPTYSHKFRWILEGLVAINTSTGVNLFMRPEIHNSGDFWLYCMDLNYWYQHFGDHYSLIWPYANGHDAYISGLMAAMTDNPYVKWYSQTTKTNPNHIPFYYLSENELPATPPIDIPQARAFLDTGQLSAYDKFYDHGSNRIFFRSSKWGGHSHAHADSNAFVIHAGNEILAADASYYTFSGDTYHVQWSDSTVSKNSILINGKGQGRDLPYHGQITRFYNGGNFTYFVGDASKAYEAPMKTFKRAMLFIRPNIYIAYDELAATEKSTFSWLLNTFAEPEIDANNQKMTVAQQDERLQVQQVLPQADLKYSTDNKRPYPMKTKAWSRFTEAFPQNWHTEVTTPTVSDANILTLMQTYKQQNGANVALEERYETPSTIGLKINDEGRDGVILFRRHLDNTGTIKGGNAESSGESAAIFTRNNQPEEWMIANGQHLSWQEKVLFQSEKPANISAAFNANAAKAIIHFDGKPNEIKLSLDAAPQKVLLSDKGKPESAKTLKSTFEDGYLTVNIAADSGTIWVDPVVDLTAPIPPAALHISDTLGDYDIPLRGAWSQNGDWIYHAQKDVREIGNYRFRADGTELLIQDIWDPRITERGRNEVKSTFREGTELYFTAKPGTALNFNANLEESFRGSIDNVLNNGDFESGIPQYLPRFWVMSKHRDSDDMGWGGWSQEDAHSGNSSLRLYREKGRRTMTSQPMRLRESGTYHLRFYAKGDIAAATVNVIGQLGKALNVPVKASKNWQKYEATIELPPGYTTVQIAVPNGKEGTLWVDDVEFGRIP